MDSVLRHPPDALKVPQAPEPVRDRGQMLAAMEPRIAPGLWVFCAVADGAPVPSDARATFAEDEGMSAILPVATAAAIGADTALPMACITLTVHSALDGVGLTAAVASALADAGIACNMVAALRHDHVFVPADKAPRAMDVLCALQALHRR